MKQCRSCGVEKPLSEFHNKQADCKECRSRFDRERYLADRSNYYKRTYGITEADYDAMYFEQEGCCAICGKHQTQDKRRFCVDHCHETGNVRALLCHNCNTALGKFQDNEDLLRRAADYIRSTKTGFQTLSTGTVESVRPTITN